MVSVTYVEDTANTNDLLFYAQTIADAFAKAIDQNECNVKLLIGFTEELEQERDKFVDIIQLIENPTYSLQEGSYLGDNYTEGEPIYNTNETLYDSPLSYQDIVNIMKEDCIDCDFNLPTLDLSSNLNWSFDRLRLMLNLFDNIVKSVLNPNLCHVSNIFASSCIPSIIALIMLLVSTYAAVLALQKLGGISISAFIQGIISGLLGQILASLSLRLNMSNTGVGCIVTAIREIANELLSQNDQVLDAVPIEVLERLGYAPPSSNSSYIDKEEAAHEEWTREDFLETYVTMSEGAKRTVDRYLDQVQSEMTTFNKTVSDAFKQVAETVDDVVGSVNEELQNMFGLLDFFQCENARSGLDFSSILEFTNKLMTVINLLSAILSVVAKKQVAKLCKTKASVYELSDILAEESLAEPLTDLEQTEVISEFLGKVVELTKDGDDRLVPLIYDKDQQPTLPKLSLLSCNLKEFIEAHSIENVIDSVIREIDNGSEEKQRDSFFGVDPETTEIPIRKPNDSNYVNNRTWEKYPIKYEVPKYSTNTSQDLSTITVAETINGLVGSSSSIQSIVEMVYSVPSKKVEINSENNQNPSSILEDTYNNTSNNYNKLRTQIGATSKKKAIENKCKDIADVLDILNSLGKNDTSTKNKFQTML